MFCGRDVICLSSLDWASRWQGPQAIMSLCADAGNRVLYVENLGVRPPGLADLPRVAQRLVNWLASEPRSGLPLRANLRLYAPLALPWHRPRLVPRLNALWLGPRIHWISARMGMRLPILWACLPTRLTIELARRLPHALLVYYVADDFPALPRASRTVQAAEQALLERADLVFAAVPYLRDKCVGANPRTYYVPPGVDMAVFDGERADPQPLPPDVAYLPRPILGLVGASVDRTDLQLVAALARAAPDASVVIVGEIEDRAALPTLANLHTLGERPYQDVPRYIRAFDVCLVPWQQTPMTRHGHPTKLNQYLAMGKPVVATALDGIASYADVVRIAQSREEFVAQAVALARDPAAAGPAAARIERARRYDWPHLVAGMSDLIVDALARKEREETTRHGVV